MLSRCATKFTYSLKCFMNRIIYLILLSLMLGPFSLAKAEWKNCPYSEHEAEDVFNVFLAYMKTVDPGPGVIFDPKCRIDVICKKTADGSEAVFHADCPLLKLEGHDIEKMKRTGKRHKFSKTVINKTNTEPYLKN